jgi:hypothetical protein
VIEQFKAIGRTRVAGQMNKTEALHAQTLELLRRAGEIHDYRFESVTLILGHDCRYTPDFFVILANGSIEIHEVKGGHITDDGAVKLRAAARAFPWFTFKLCQYDKRQGWNVSEVKT